jgi:hypothetical protein
MDASGCQRFLQTDAQGQGARPVIHRSAQGKKEKANREQRTANRDEENYSSLFAIFAIRHSFSAQSFCRPAWAM